MASISISNLSANIDLFNKDLNECDISFKNVEEKFIILKCSNQAKKYEIKDVLSEIHGDLLRTLNRISINKLDENKYIESNGTQFNDFRGVLNSFKLRLTEVVKEIELSKELFLKLYQDCQIYKESQLSRSQDSFPISSNKINLHILHSRQTNEPFIVKIMKTGFRYKCIGCSQNIPIQSLYLSHVEEYPAGTKTFIPHSYHISQNCLFERGFEMDYLMKINVTSNEVINKDVKEVLIDIGFKMKNIRFVNSDRNHRDSSGECEKDLSDDKSDISDGSSVISGNGARQKGPKSVFIYRRIPESQKKVLHCAGCQSKINKETYVTSDTKETSAPFHIKKTCLKKGGVLPDNLSSTKVKVFKLLKTHNDIKELISCGFYYNNIIGFRPPSTNVKNSAVSNLNNKPKPFSGDHQTSHDKDFIFNNEPFAYERLPHSEKCKGCQEFVRKDEMTLRHKERVPRDKLDHSPLISQYYHATKQCLISRGFTMKYLSFIKCNAMLSGDNNLSKVTNILTDCGFFNENITYSPREISDVRGFESQQQSHKIIKEYKLFIENCVNSSAHCEGCGFILMPNQPCFIYALEAIQDSHAKMFHIRASCLKAHFTKEQIMSMTCVNNNIIDVSPNDIINCGIVKIVTDNQYNSQQNRFRNNFVPRSRPVKQKPLLRDYGFRNDPDN